jgi:hypothetical protein
MIFILLFKFCIKINKIELIHHDRYYHHHSLSYYYPKISVESLRMARTALLHLWQKDPISLTTNRTQ